MSTTPDVLLNDSACFACETPGEWRVIQLELLRQILLANNPMANTSPDSLLESGKCFACYTPGDWQIMELELLRQILDSGGAGGGGIQRVFLGAFGDPNGNQTANGAAVYYDSDGSVWGHYSVDNNDTDWFEIISA